MRGSLNASEGFVAAAPGDTSLACDALCAIALLVELRVRRSVGALDADDKSIISAGLGDQRVDQFLIEKKKCYLNFTSATM